MPDKVKEIVLAGYHRLLETGNRHTYVHGTSALHIYDYPVRLSWKKESVDIEPGMGLICSTGNHVHYNSPAPGRHFCFHYRFFDPEEEKQNFPDPIAVDLRKALPEYLRECEKIRDNWNSDSEWLQKSAPSLLWALICRTKES